VLRGARELVVWDLLDQLVKSAHQISAAMMTSEMTATRGLSAAGRAQRSSTVRVVDQL